MHSWTQLPSCFHPFSHPPCAGATAATQQPARRALLQAWKPLKVADEPFGAVGAQDRWMYRLIAGTVHKGSCQTPAVDSSLMTATASTCAATCLLLQHPAAGLSRTLLQPSRVCCLLCCAVLAWYATCPAALWTGTWLDFKTVAAQPGEITESSTLCANARHTVACANRAPKPKGAAAREWQENPDMPTSVDRG